MEIKEILFNIVNYFIYTRGAGHTEAVLNGVENTEDCFMMVSDDRQTKDLLRKSVKLSGKIIDFSHFETNKLRGFRKPLVFDNFVLTIIFSRSLNRIQELEKENRQLKSKIETAKLALQ